MADDTGLDFSDQIGALESKYEQVNYMKLYHITDEYMILPAKLAGPFTSQANLSLTDTLMLLAFAMIKIT